MKKPDKILRKPHVREVTNLSDATIWRMENRGEFPKRVKLSSRAVGWRESEVLTWIEDRKTGTGG